MDPQTSARPDQGDRLVDFTLPDSLGLPRALSSLTPCVLVLYRGHW